MAKKPSVFVNKEVAAMFGRMAKAAAANAIRHTTEGNYSDAIEAAGFAKDFAEEAGGNVMRGVVLQ